MANFTDDKLHFFYAGWIERGNGKPGYSKVIGYSHKPSLTITEHPARTRREWQQQYPGRCVFHAKETHAIEALRTQMTTAYLIEAIKRPVEAEEEWPEIRELGVNELQRAAPSLYAALRLMLLHFKDLRNSNKNYMANLCLQDYGLMNRAFVDARAVGLCCRDGVKSRNRTGGRINRVY